MRTSLRAVFFGWLTLFLISALIGALISYNTALAWSRFAAIAVGVAVCILFATLPEKIRAFDQNDFSPLRIILAWLPAALLIYFILTNDWTARVGKLAWLDPVLRWFAAWQTHAPGLALNSNSFGGTLAMLIPLQIVALWDGRRRARIVALVLVFASLMGLIVSASRGAWIACALIAWIAAMWFVLERVMPGWQQGRRRLVIWGALVVYLALTIGLAVTLTPLGAWLLNEGGGHWQVARNSFDLVSDYLFTGIGLGAFTMAYSSYVLLVHVPHTIHAHNLFLDIWLEQGLLGLFAFVSLIIVGVLNIPGSRWRFAALASLGVMLIHGLLDDPFYGYGGSTIPFVLIPLGILGREAALTRRRWWAWLTPALVGGLALIGLLVLLLPPTRAMIEANVGALAQTRAELAVYEWPRYSFQDQLRRDGIVDLEPSITHYQNALALDPLNTTAHRRLGQIELSRGAYDVARAHLEMAYKSAPHQSATRWLLGELDALEGNLDQAARWWGGLGTELNPLQTRLWWYEFIGDHERLQKLREAIARMKF
jgi:hypothetical protein